MDKDTLYNEACDTLNDWPFNEYTDPVKAVLRSLMEYCNRKNISFRDSLESAEAEFN